MDVTHNFTAGTRAVAQQVNQNFADVKSAIDPLQTDVADIKTQLTSGIILPDGSVDFTRLQSYKTYTVSNATNATPIVVTAVGHGFLTGDKVYISGVGGNTAANGTFTITKIGTDTFSLDGSVGNGAFSSNGTAVIYPSADDNLVDKIAPVTPNSVNSAKVNASGYADYIAKVSDTSVVHYAGGSNPNIVETDVLGRTHTITADETITGITNDGTYEMIKEYDLATGEPLASAPVAVSIYGIKDGTAISGGDYSGYPKENAFEEPQTVAWQSSQLYTGVSGVAYIGKNFGSSKTFQKISLSQWQDHFCTSVKVQSSTNGSTWVDVQTFSGLIYGKNYLFLTNPLTTQYVRILANSNIPRSGYAWSVEELRFDEHTITEVQTLPTITTALNGNYYTVTGVKPNRQYKVVAGAYVETTFVKRGQVTKTAGTMGTPSSYAFGATKSMPAHVIETYVNGTSWYRVWSD